MLSFSTEFPVEEASASVFCGSVAKWLGGSPHTQVSEEDVLDIYTSSPRAWEGGNERITCLLNEGDGESSAAFRYLKVDDGIEWVTTVGFSANHVDSWVSVRTERNSDTAFAYLPPVKKPFVIRNLLSELGGGVDGELRVQELPHLLGPSDESMMVRLMNGDATHHLPFVYVSIPFENEHVVDYLALARHLAGVAHVIVEMDRSFSRTLQPQVFSQNPYGGYIGIAFPSGEWIRIDPFRFASEFDARKEIFVRIRDSLLSRRAMPRCSWTGIRAQSAKQNRKSADASEGVDHYAAMFDREIEAKDELLREAEAEIARLQSLSIERRKEASAKHQGASVRLSKEQELEPSEFTEVILDAVEHYHGAIEEGSRRSHILSDIIDSNERPAILKSKRNEIKTILRGYRNLDAASRGKIEKLGFSIEEEGKHFKLIYRGDSRYQYTLSKTPSDGRTGINSATQISRLFF